MSKFTSAMNAARQRSGALLDQVAAEDRTAPTRNDSHPQHPDPEPPVPPQPTPPQPTTPPPTPERVDPVHAASRLQHSTRPVVEQARSFEPESTRRSTDSAVGQRTPLPDPGLPFPLAPASAPRRGRPPGKRSSTETVQVTAYIQSETHYATKLALLVNSRKEGPRQDFSDLMESLLQDWLRQQNR